ncbi:MAG TPA: hypothetical protein VGL56_18425 [Fimbriimonadaceae bacterium]
MIQEEVEIFTPVRWTSQLPPPARAGAKGGKPLALTPDKAGHILASVAQGVKPKAAFLLAGLSAETYQRYVNLVNKHQTGQLEKNQNNAYIVAFFKLQQLAINQAIMQYANAQARAVNGEVLKSGSTKTITTTRQAVVKGEVIELVDVKTTIVKDEKERVPRLPRASNFIEENYF